MGTPTATIPAWLAKKYPDILSELEGGIDRLNDTYGTTFWSQEYNGFDEIPLPAETITTHNPGLPL